MIDLLCAHGFRTVCELMNASANRFFVLKHNPIDLGPAEVEFLASGRRRMGAAPTCPRCGQYTGMLEWLPPYRVALTCYGQAFGDIAYGSGLLVSERFRALWDEHGLTGLVGFEPVEVCRIKRRLRFKGDPPPYFHVSVARTRAAIDPVRSGVVWEEPPQCSECRIGNWLRYERVVLESGTWGGEDLFTPCGFHLCLASERFKEFCEQFKITNAILIRAEEYEYDSYPERNIELARELLQAPLGDDLLEIETAEGYLVRYCPSKNRMVFRWADGTIEIDRPFGGREFWEDIKAGRARLQPPRRNRPE
jgi:hypothetical protein